MKEGVRVHHSYGSYAPSTYGSYEPRRANPSTAGDGANLRDADRWEQAAVVLGINPIVILERKKATEYGRKTGIKWLSCTAK
jgi:hypothetical protein